ncbi:MAG: hypothetical protein ACKV2Q_07340 [Planctomycetaceae bacterium]
MMQLLLSILAVFVISNGIRTVTKGEMTVSGTKTLVGPKARAMGFATVTAGIGILGFAFVVMPYLLKS